MKGFKCTIFIWDGEEEIQEEVEIVSSKGKSLTSVYEEVKGDIPELLYDLGYYDEDIVEYYFTIGNY